MLWRRADAREGKTKADFCWNGKQQIKPLALWERGWGEGSPRHGNTDNNTDKRTN